MPDPNDKIRDHDLVAGYLHPLYAASLAEFGTPRELASCGGWILEREIPGSGYRDAMGCYPVFSCKRWDLLAADLVQLEGQVVSLAFVTDPFGDFAMDDLTAFDKCFPYKQHYVTDLSVPIEQAVRKGHRKQARKALRKVVVETCLDPQNYVAEWAHLYDSLVNRHSIRGIRRFSQEAFEKQLRIPGTVYFRVLYKGMPVGGNVFYLHDDVAYGHLSAFTDDGYSLGAAYAVKWAAIEYFVGKARWMSIGGAAGLDETGDGLAFFKRGWATETRPAYFCGRILDRERYDELARTSGFPNSTYFPVYRTGEFA